MVGRRGRINIFGNGKQEETKYHARHVMVKFANFCFSGKLTQNIQIYINFFLSDFSNFFQQF